MTCKDGRYAAIDIGTVTTRMLIADIADGKLTELDKQYTITNLGEGVDATGRLSEEAMLRVGEAIDRYLAIRSTFETADTPITTLAMATSAARDAENSSDFTEMLQAKGLELTVIRGEEEAGLTFNGVSAAFPDEYFMVVDIGGGSTEIVVGTGGQKPVEVRSFNIGCRRVTERFLRMDPPDHQELSSARGWIHQEFQPFFDDLWEQRAVPDRVVAVAGTATTVVSVRDHMEVYDSEKVDKVQVSFEELHAITEMLATLDLKQRRHVVGLDPNRAPVIVAGLIILEEVLNAAAVNSFTVSEADILNGMVLYAASQG